ncbi:MAG: helix-turn-helix transcriptional regulator [Candidatus Sumerlaeia bacterium]|nr:helix-turn-helix transcriptional regulator [Candidatus Sumerlaeia bacterium]
MFPEELKAVREAAQVYEALASEGPEPLRRRRLKVGEEVDAPEIGFPGAKLSGTGIWVDEYPDGTLVPIIPAFGKLLEVIFRSIVVEKERPLSAGELRFLRHYLKFTQEELADRVGLSREQVCRMESGKAPILPTVSLAVRHLGLLEMLNGLPAEIRDNLRPEFERLQSALAGCEVIRFQLPQTMNGELTISRCR